MYKMFNEKRVKLSKNRKTKLIQNNPVVDYLTTEEYMKKEEKQSIYRLYVVHPFEIIDIKTKEKKLLKIGDAIDVFYSDLKEFFELDEWFPVTFRNKIFNHPIGDYYFQYKENEATNKKNYLANLHSLYDCTIPFDYKFYFWLSWKGLELEYSHKNYMASEYAIQENIEIAANILGFLRFSDKIAYKTFHKSLADAILKYIAITRNEPSYYEETQAKSSLRSIVMDLNKVACEMNIVEPVYKSFERYLEEVQIEAIRENQMIENAKAEEKQIHNMRRKMNESLLEDLYHKEDFFSDFNNC